MPLSRSVAVRLKAEMSDFRREWREAGKEADRAGDKIKGAGKKAKQTEVPIGQLETTVARTTARLKRHRAEWDAVGTSFLRSGMLIAAAGVLMTKAAMDWESQWTGVTKTVEGTPAMLSKVEAGLRGLAKTLPESHKNIAKVAEAAGQLGIATGDVVEFTRVMVMLGDTTDLTADEAATSLAQLMNVMGTAPDKVDELASTLVYLGNRGASTEKQIVQMAQRIASAGAIVGLSESDVLAVANAVASTGIEVEAGGSAISKVLIDIGKAVDSGGGDLTKFAEVAGMSATDFTNAWRSDPASALASFTEGLGQLDEKGQSAFVALEQLGQSDVRTTRALLNLANSSDMLRNSLADGNAEWERNQALVEEAGKRYDTASARAEIAWNNIKDNAIDAGQGMLPVVSEMADAVSALAGVFGMLPGPIKGSIAPLALVTGGSLLLVGGLMKAAGAVTTFKANLAALELQSPRTAGAVGKLTKAAAGALAVFTALQIAGKFYDSGDRAGVATYTSQLLDMGDGAAAARKSLDKLFTIEGPGSEFWGQTYADINGLDDAIRALQPGKLESLQQGLQGIFTETRKEAAEKSFAQVDKALTGLLADGAGDEAAGKFRSISAAFADQGKSVKDLAAAFPGYSDALQNLENDQKLAGKSTEELAEKSTYLNQALGRMGGAEDAEKKLDQLRQSIEDAGDAWTDATLQFDDKSTLKSWISDLEEAAQAQEKWADNMVKAAARGVDADVLSKLQEQGSAAAGVLDELANGSQKSIDKVNTLLGSLGSTSSVLAGILAEVGDDILVQFDVKGDKDAVAKAMAVANATELPKDYVRTILDALDWATDDINKVLDGMDNLDGTAANPTILTNDDRAQAAIRSVLAGLRAIDGKNWVANIIQTTTKRTVFGDDRGNAARGGYTGLQVPAGYAGGGKVPGTPPADPRVDNVWGYGARSGEPIRVRSGEWIVNEPQSRKNDKWLGAVNAGLNIDDFMADLASSIITNGMPIGYAAGGRHPSVIPGYRTGRGTAASSTVLAPRWGASAGWSESAAYRAPAPASGAGGPSSSTRGSAQRTYQINAYAPTEVASEFVRLIRFAEGTSALGAGV